MKEKCTNCKKEVIYEEGFKPTFCPYCEIRYWEKPVNERSLHILQEEYLRTRSERVLGEMSLLIKEMLHNIVIGKMKGKGSYTYDEDLEDVVYDSLLKVIGYYREKPDFQIEASFTGYLSQVVLYPLYNGKKQLRQKSEISMNTPIGSGEGKELTLEDRIMTQEDESSISNHNYFLNDVHEDDIVRSLGEFLEEVFYMIAREQGFRYAILNWALVNHFLSGKHSKFFNHCWEVYPNDVLTNYENTLIQVKKFLMEENQVKDTDLK